MKKLLTLMMVLAIGVSMAACATEGQAEPEPMGWNQSSIKR